MSKPRFVSRKVIIDTDPGVDDALALLLAMSSPELKIEAITAVAGNVPVELAVANALRMVQVAGRTDIRVAAGARKPLERNLVTATSHGRNGLGGVDFPAPTMRPVDEPAAEVIRTIVSGSPGEVSIIALGPLTNIASVLRNSAKVGQQIKEIVLMGGSLSGGNMTPVAEFNMFVDPEAARIVFGSGIPLTMVGLDVTRKCVVTKDHVTALQAGDSAICKAAEQIAGSGMRPMHDPLAVAAFIDRSLLQLRKYFVAIGTRDDLNRGQTVGYETDSPNADVAVGVDAERFFDVFIGRLSGRGGTT